MYYEQMFKRPSVTRSDLSSTITRSATSYTSTGLTITPGIGKYMVFGSLQARNGTVNGQIRFGVALNGTVRTATERDVTTNTAILGVVTLSADYINIPVVLFDYIETASDSDTIDIHYRSVDGQTATVTNRSLFLLKI